MGPEGHQGTYAAGIHITRQQSMQSVESPKLCTMIKNKCHC